MSKILLNDFDGIYPRQSPTLLKDNAAQIARNVKLMSGEVRPWRKARKIKQVLQDGVVSIFKMEGVGGEELWCEWTVDTDVCYGPVADQDEFRIYYSEGGVCKKTNWELCSEGDGPAPRNWYYMGTPHPKGALTLNAVRTGEESTENTENRVYVYTYVSEFGSITEESAPSDPATVIADREGGSVEISGFADPPTDHLNITRVRIYRMVSGDESASYMLVDELSLKDHKFPATGVSLNEIKWSDSKYVDTRTTEQLGKELDSLEYSEPPEGLKGLVSMPNGFLAGFVRNEIWFSEPYLPHAWPSKYMLTTDSPIVGLGVYGNTLVVATTRQPYTISGTHPSAMTQEKQPMMQPCVSKRSIAYDQYGVLYASPYGVVAIAGGQLDVFTRQIATQDEWRAYNPSTMSAVMYNNLYMLSYKKDHDNFMLVFSRGDTPSLVEYSFPPDAMFVERGSGRLFLLNRYDGWIYQMDADTVNAERYEWKSKRFVNPYWTSFSAMKVDAAYESNDTIREWEEYRKEAVAENKAIWASRKGKSLMGEFNAGLINQFEVNGSLLKSLPTKADFRYVTVTLYADGKEVYTKTFTDILACRIPAVKGYAWEIRLVGTMNIRSFAMSTTMNELSSPN